MSGWAVLGTFFGVCVGLVVLVDGGPDSSKVGHMHRRASRCRLPILVVDRQSLVVVALYGGGWWRLVMLDFRRCRCCRRCRCRCHFQGHVVVPKPVLGSLRPDVGRHAGVGWRGQLDGMDDEMNKTNHDFHRGSSLRRTRWASHSFGPPLCFSLPQSTIERQ